MTENKRYQLRHEDLDYPSYSDLVDTEDNDRVICTFNNDSGTNKMVVLLNEQDERIKKLSEENEKLKKEKEFWKGAACNCSNYLSILSMDCQIVQEAICDLKNVIDVDTEAFRLLDELDDKFDELNQHRIRCMR